MCSNLGSMKIKPTTKLGFIKRNGSSSGTWGFRNGHIYNVRCESLRSVWKDIRNNRGIIYMDSFWENGKQFVRKDGKPFIMAVIYNDQEEIAVITMPANTLVEEYHHRMPMIIEDSQLETWLNPESDEVCLFPETEMLLKAA